MPNSIDFYKRIFLRVIPARIIVPCKHLRLENYAIYGGISNLAGKDISWKEYFCSEKIAEDFWSLYDRQHLKGSTQQRSLKLNRGPVKTQLRGAVVIEKDVVLQHRWKLGLGFAVQRCCSKE